MSREVYAVAADTSLEVATRLLCERHIGGAPVLDEHGLAVGMVTQVDLLSPDRLVTDKIGHAAIYRLAEVGRQLLHGGRVASPGIVADVMSPYVLSVSPQTPIAQAARLMVAEGVHRLLVTKHGRVVGILSTMDVLRAVVR